MPKSMQKFPKETEIKSNQNHTRTQKHTDTVVTGQKENREIKL